MFIKLICREGEPNAAGGSSNSGTPGAGTANPPANSDSGNPAATGNAPAAASWLDTLPAETKGYVENKGFKDPAAVIESYRNLEKLQGVPLNRLLKLPEKPDDAEWSNVYKQLGRPEKAEDYTVKPLDESANSKAFVDWAKKTFLDVGLTNKQAENLVAKWNEQNQNYIKTADEALAAKLIEQQNSLKKEWGAAYEHQMKIAKEAARTFGMTPEQVDQLEKVMGFDGTMKHLHAIGSRLGEGDFVTGGNTSGGKFNAPMSPAAAKDRIQQLMSDPEFRQKYAAGNIEARQTMDKLHEYASPEMQNA